MVRTRIISVLLALGAATSVQASKPVAAPASGMAFAAAAARNDQPKIAAKLYRDATLATPKDATVWFGLGKALEADGSLGEAIAALERAGELQPGLPGLACARGRAELRAGHLAEAEISYRTATTEAPADTRGWVGLGITLDLQRRHSEAQAAYAGALRSDPLDRAARNNMALSVALQGHPAEAAGLLAPWAGATDAPDRMRGNLLLLQAAAAPTLPSPAGVDPALVAALRSVRPEPRP